VDILSARTADVENVNPYMPGAVPMDAGFHQLIFGHLWEIDTVKGEQFPDLAATMPEALDDSNTKFSFKVQEGLAWSDGTEFTAADIEFTSDMILNTKELGYSVGVMRLESYPSIFEKTRIRRNLSIPILSVLVLTH
jgi:peptide/nickel transport system substrate-binding protein